MRNSALVRTPCIHELCVIVRKFFYRGNFPALQSKDLFFRESRQSRLESTSTHQRTITHYSRGSDATLHRTDTRATKPPIPMPSVDDEWRCARRCNLPCRCGVNANLKDLGNNHDR